MHDHSVRPRFISTMTAQITEFSDLLAPTPADVIDAAERLRDIAIQTPLLQSERLNALAGGTVLVKMESLQRTGAFKFRGAYNSMSRLDRGRYPRGVLAYSTGNHGQAVATVGKLLDIPVTVVMPSDAPRIKMEKARVQGATVVLYDRNTESREAISERLGASGGYALIPPGDHPHVIAGQGTAVFEALRALPADAIDVIVVPCGGGGLAAGSALAADAVDSTAQLWAAEPERCDDTRRSLRSGTRETNPPGATSLCDALLAPTPAMLPFSINRQRLSGVITADDAAVLTAMRILFEDFRVAVEPGGAIGVASLLADPGMLGGRRALVVASGGNVDPQLFIRAIA
ncbi:threonine/serine dehydratase [Burkholderia sp. Cy-647]|uniref:threonine ammonia-lyase n=2 Tax=Burkholderia TaxID=32008 RepID=UPI0031F5929A